MPSPFEPSNKSSVLWTLSLGLIAVAVASSAYNPVSGTWAWHGDLPELHWKNAPGPFIRIEHPATFISLVRDCLVAGLLAGLCAWFARKNTRNPHWAGIILCFILMSNNIRLALQEFRLISRDQFGDYQHLWYLMLFHLLVGALSLACLLPLLLHVRRDRGTSE